MLQQGRLKPEQGAEPPWPPRLTAANSLSKIKHVIFIITSEAFSSLLVSAALVY